MKRTMSTGSVCVANAVLTGKAAILAAACCMAATASAGVVGWWRFNGEGANVPNVAATADGLPDGTPRATDGTIMSITTYGANPSYGSDSTEMPVVTNLFQQVAPRLIDQKTGSVYAGGKTLRFGEDGLDGGVIVPYDETFLLTNFTVEVMVRFPEDAAARASTGDKMFPLVQFGRDSQEGWLFAVYDGFPFVRINYVSTSDEEVTNPSSTATKSDSYMKYMPTLFDGQWHHLGMRVNLNTTTQQLFAYFYVDGRLCGGKSFNNFNRWLLSGNCPLAIGCQPYYSVATRTFWGDIAEVRISNEVLQDNNLLVPLVDGPADDDTALLLTFDSAAKGIGCTNQYVVPCIQDTTVAAQSTNHIWFGMNWNIHNAAYNNPYIPRWYPFSDVGNTDHLLTGLRPTLSRNDTWGATYGADALLAANAGSLNIPTCTTNGAAAPGTDVINVPNLNSTLPTGDFTIEFVIKTEAASTSEADTFFYCPFLKWCISNGKVLARGFKTSYGSSVGDLASGAINDGKWHHAAYVYDKDAASVRHYVDYKLIGSKSGTLFVSQNANETDKRCFIGAQKRELTSGTSGAQAFRGKIDAMRVTRRILIPSEFLSTRSAEKLMTVTFDDAEHPYSTGQEGCIAPAEGVAGALDGGVAPEIVDGRAGWYVLDGSNGVDKVECGKAVQLAGSTLLWQNTTLLERNDLTVEFFARFSDLRTSANILRFVRAGSSGASVDSSIIWAVYATNGTHYRFDIRAVTNGVLSAKQSGGNFAPITETDNTWHHWALTVDATSGTNVVAKFYKDYEQLGDTVKLTGKLDLPPQAGYGTGLTIGGTGVAEAYTYGTFDQVRVSAGILPVDKFMRYDNVKSTVIYVR